MKKLIAFLHSITQLLSLMLTLGMVMGCFCGCMDELSMLATEPSQTTGMQIIPDQTYALNDYEDGLWGILAELTAANHQEWGCYTVRIDGLSSPVFFELEGVEIRSISACGHTVQVERSDQCRFYDDGPNSPYQMYVQDHKGIIIVGNGENRYGHTWLFTPEKTFAFHPENGISIMLYVYEGELLYDRVNVQYDDELFDQNEMALLDCAYSRDDFYAEHGSAKIENGEIILTAERNADLSDYFDLDTLFSDAKALGRYEEYATLDDLLEANRTKRMN